MLPTHKSRTPDALTNKSQVTVLERKSLYSDLNGTTTLFFTAFHKNKMPESIYKLEYFATKLVVV